MRPLAASVLLFVIGAAAAANAAEHPSLARARVLYNTGDFEGALAEAAVARLDPGSAAAAALVTARTYLERFRLRTQDPGDLAAAREALNAVQVTMLSPRDRIDLLVGLGQALYLAGTYGAAAELFDAALNDAALLPDRDRALLLDWWATALDREAQTLAGDLRAAPLQRVISRMEEELRQDPGNAAANYWLAASARAAGDVERAWHAAVAAWVRATLRPATAAALRADIDNLVTTALIPERARTQQAQEREAADDLRAQWALVKEQWR